MRKIKVAPSIPTEVEVNEVSQNRAEIVAYPFETGYAVTLAHPLRRLIMGSSIGYAPISIKIEGASHEFDTIRGMHQDVAVLIINLKNIRFKILDENRDRVEVNYSFSGVKDIKASDLANDLVEIIDGDLPVATPQRSGAWHHRPGGGHAVRRRSRVLQPTTESEHHVRHAGGHDRLHHRRDRAVADQRHGGTATGRQYAAHGSGRPAADALP